MKKKLAKKKPTLKELEKILGSKELVLFFVSWLKHDRNATKAYQELHPKAKYESAMVLGSITLRKIKMEAVLDAYGLDYNAYFNQLKEGLEAGIRRRNLETGEIWYDPDHKTRKGYHETLGKLLGIEGAGPSSLTQVNINLDKYIVEVEDEKDKL